ncbi:MAG: ABC transporter substrate-binding protein [Actinomycetota bacterium]
MKKRSIKLLAVPVALGLVAAACGSDDDGDADEADTEEASDDAEADDSSDEADAPEGDGEGLAGGYTDVDFFYLPPVGDEFGSPLLTAGTFASAFSADEETMAALEYMASPEYVTARLEGGAVGFLSANNKVDVSEFPTAIDRAQIEILQSADVARFDGSDLMPGAVGAGTFWSAIVNITSEEQTVAEAFADVQTSFAELDPGSPASECPAPDAGGDPDGVVTIFGPETEGELEAFRASMAPFTEATGIEVEIAGDQGFAEQIGVQVDGGSAPDIAIFPQPGRVVDFARSCDLVPLADNVADVVQENFGGFADLGVVDGVLVGVPNKTDVKSLMWYSPTAFDEKGYSIPTTHDELVALMDQAVADGVTPLCIGIGSDASTGWPGTDWTEDYMLRLKGPDFYDQWVNNEVAFDDPEVIEVGEFWFDIWSNPDYVFGGLQNVGATSFRDQGQPLVDGECLLHRQANFFANFFPEGVQVGPAE